MSEKYLGEVSTPLLINQIKENCAQKRTTLPIPSVDELGHIYQYMGVTSGSLIHGYFYECVSDGQDPATYSWSQVNTQPTPATPTASGTTFDNTTSGLQATNVQGAIDEVVGDLGTASSKDFTPNVAPNNHNLVESNAVYNAITTALTSIYTPRGDLSCAELTSSLLVAANVGNIYEMSDAGTTSALFLQGAGKTIHVGDNVGIIQTGVDTYKFNLMANAFDMTDYQKKDLTQSVEGATTVEGALGALSTNKADKVSSATNGDFAGLDANGNLTDSGKKASDFATAEGLENEVVTRSAMGAKNLIPFPYPKASDTVLGIDFTTNSNGEVIASGTSTGIAVYDVVNTELYGWNNIPREGTYILSDGLSDADYVYAYTAVTFMYDDGTIEYNVGDTSVGRTVITIPSNLKNFYIGCCVRTDKTVSNIKFKPMLRLATDADSTYQLYAMTNQQITPYVQAISNPNLLDNPWFTVNQRGVTNAWNTQFSYGVDRWRKQTGISTTLSVTANGITEVDGKAFGVFQIVSQSDEEVKSLYGKTLTFSVMYSDGTIDKGSALLPSDHYSPLTDKIVRFVYNTAKCDYLEIESYTTGKTNIVASMKAGATIRAIKLELGSVSTLAMDTAPNYATELLKCQRYFYAFNSKPSLSGHSFAIIGTGYATSANNIRVPFYLPVEMRIVPTVSVSALSDVVIMSEVSDAATPSTIAVDSASCDRNNIGLFNIASDGNFVKGHSASVYTKNGCRIDLSADL